LIDDYGYADISYEGNSQIKTPNIDRIAINGAHFTRFYQSSAACAPTRASLLTGRYHLQTGVWGVHTGRDFIQRDETTIADVLKDAGYITGAFGKWHSGKTWRYFSWNRGFDVGIHSKLYRYFDTNVIYNNKYINVEGPITDVIGDQVVRFIQQNKNEPFFAYVPFQSIHEPFNCPPEVFRKYKNEGYSDHVARLYGMIEVLDNNIGKILNTVEDLGLTENTVIMFLNDDGPSPGCDLTYQNRRMNNEEKAERKRGWDRELRGGKGSIWEGGSVTPFYIQWKNKIVPGSEFKELSGVIDLFPTILDICGLEIPGDNLPVHGQSFWPLIKGEGKAEWAERKYFDNTNFYLKPRHTIDMDRPQMHHISLHYKNYKLIRADETLYGGITDSVYYLLYDLKNDPLESVNVLDENPEIADELISDVERWYDEVIKGGRAFRQPVYEIGHWEDAGSAINLDGFRDVWGSVADHNRTSFRIGNWSAAGSGINFNLEVVEDGRYLVELGYTCASNSLGSLFRICTEYDTASLVINNENTSFSDTLSLPAGKQTLTVELDKIGTGSYGVDYLSRLIVHRITEEEDFGILKNLGIQMEKNSGENGSFYRNSATADFLYGEAQVEPLKLNKGESVNIKFVADNPEQVEQVIIYVGFDQEDIISEAPFEYIFTPSKVGQQTINGEFISKAGIAYSVHADIIVE
jgi:arylsulfatase A-like enzyme